jgi:hypothetical protein
MISKFKFELIKAKYGHYASWAIWAKEGEKPKDNVEDLSVFDIQNNPSILQNLNPEVIFVGLNISRKIKKPFGDFHDSRPGSTDFKIRYAFNESLYWGGYMTDIIKDFEEKASGKMMVFLKNNKNFEKKNIETFRIELKDIGAKSPTLIAFGNDTYKILKRNFNNEFKIIKVLHYAAYISKEEYRRRVIETLKNQIND